LYVSMVCNWVSLGKAAPFSHGSSQQGVTSEAGSRRCAEHLGDSCSPEQHG
jgi:hypothetical protein